MKYLHSLSKQKSAHHTLLRADVLEFAGAEEEVVGVSLGGELAGVGLLHEELVALLLSKVNSILLSLEAEMCALHVVARRLPSHQRVLPAVTLGKNIPVHAPIMTPPSSGLCGGL